MADNDNGWFSDITSWIDNILPVPLSDFLGWFRQAEWLGEVGELANNSVSPGTGILGELEKRLGQTFTDLRSEQQKVVDAWRTFQRAAPWDKERTAEAYEAQVKSFLVGVKAQIEALPELPVGGIVDIWTWLKKWWPYALAGGIVITGIGAAIAAGRKK